MAGKGCFAPIPPRLTLVSSHDRGGKPKDMSRKALITSAQRLCPDIIPDNIDALVVWEGRDTFAVRNGGPCIEIRSVYNTDASRFVPIVWNYG